MTDHDVKADLHGYLQGAREALLWKLEGLGEYDVRRPLTPTGTNLLGLVKHAAGSEVLYFGVVFDRSQDVRLPWPSPGEVNGDLWVTAEETREAICAGNREVWTTVDATIDALALDHRGRVPWWGDVEVTLQHVLVHVTAHTQRHAGHADIVRELIDGSAGLLPGHDNLPSADPAWWDPYVDGVERAARRAADRSEA